MSKIKYIFPAFLSLLLTLSSVLAQDRSGASTGSGTLALSPCRLKGWDEDVRCGQFEVFEDRQSKAGRKIALKIVVVPSHDNGKDTTPVFYFSGGPGGSAVDAVTRSGKASWANLRQHHALVFVDQRGTGGSNPLFCDMYTDKDNMASYFADPMPIGRLTQCRAELEKKADLRLYSTPIAMADLDDVRAALGYDKIDLYGGSYGSTAALAYLRQFPANVRTATIAGVAPPAVKIPLPIAKGVQSSLEKVFADCAADTRCHTPFPDPMGDLMKAAAILQKAPVAVDTANPYTGQPQKITLSRPVFSEFVRTMLYQTETARWLPLLLHQAAGGDFALFASVSFQSFKGIEDVIARGMHFSVVCGEDMPFITDAEIESETRGTFYGDYRIKLYREVCRDWPRSGVPASFDTPVRSAVPVLLLSGDADPVTPPRLATTAAGYLANSKQVIIPHSGHSFVFPCVSRLIGSFVDSGSLKGLDTACVAEIPKPVFVTEEMLKPAQPVAEAQKGTEKIFEGVLNTGRQTLRIVLHVFKTTEGKQAAYIVSPDQSADLIPIDVITIAGGKLHFEIAMLGAAYDGKLSATDDTILGEWQQSGYKWKMDLTLKK